MSFCQCRTSSRSSSRLSAFTLARIAGLFIVRVSILADSWSSVSMRSICSRRARTAPRTPWRISVSAIAHALAVRLIPGVLVVAADLWPSRAAAAMSIRHRRAFPRSTSSRLSALSRAVVARSCIGLIWILAVRRRSAERPYPLVDHCDMRPLSVLVPKGALVSPHARYRLRQSLTELLYGLWPQSGAATPCRTRGLRLMTIESWQERWSASPGATACLKTMPKRSSPGCWRRRSGEVRRSATPRCANQGRTCSGRHAIASSIVYAKPAVTQWIRLTTRASIAVTAGTPRTMTGSRACWTGERAPRSSTRLCERPWLRMTGL